MAVHQVRGFIEKAAGAGVNRVFLGLESINPETLKHTQKGQNRITEYRAMLPAWHRVGTLTLAGYVLGFPGDTPASIEREIRIIQHELPIDLLGFFILTPLPGSAATEALPRGRADGGGSEPLRRGALTTAHGTIADDELLAIYPRAWNISYSTDHGGACCAGARPGGTISTTCGRRCSASRRRPRSRGYIR